MPLVAQIPDEGTSKTVRIVHHYLMGGWSLEDTPTPGILLADEVEI